MSPSSTKGRLIKYAIRIALVVLVAILALFTWLLFPSSESPRDRPDRGLQTEETPGAGTRAAAPNGATSDKTAAPRIIGYRSTMLPGEVSSTPRKDSMGMDMMPVYEAAGSMLELSEHARAMASVETVPVHRRRLSREIRVVGKVQYDETGLAEITTRVEGYVERLFVDFTGVEVKQGDRLVEIYSPDLVVAQQELLTAGNSSRGSNLATSSTRKLLRWGLTQSQIDELALSRKVQERLTLFSPINGTVTEKKVVEQSAVKAGEVLYRLANLDSVWVYLDIYESELPWVQYGQTVDIKSEALPGQSFTGRIGFINPVLNENTRTVKVLVSIANTQKKLKPGMFVSAVISAELLANGKPAPTGVEGLWTCPSHPFVFQTEGGQCPSGKMALVQIPGAPTTDKAQGDQLPLAVPVTAVLDSGVRKIVYLEKSKGQFAPVEIVVGPRTDDAYLVLSGLSEGDNVVTRGNFLLDSQFQIRGLPSLFYKEGQGTIGGHGHDGASTQSGQPSAPPKLTPPSPPVGGAEAQEHLPQLPPPDHQGHRP
ncbi:MAG: efflux RND transporter periplasmic adaptor subunit [Bradyrhizobium sp.]